MNKAPEEVCLATLCCQTVASLRRTCRLIFLALMLIASAARAQTPVFDLHVHLWDGETFAACL
jgi:hypothetical protein